MSANRVGSLLPPRNSSGAPARLQLTSLVDMMVILVVFLLKSFSVEGQLVTPAAGLELPESISHSRPETGLMVDVGPDVIRVAGLEVIKTAALVTDSESAVATLTAALDDSQHAAQGAPVVVQADRNLDYAHLSGLLRACAAAGWNDVTLVVLEVQS